MLFNRNCFAVILTIFCSSHNLLCQTPGNVGVSTKLWLKADISVTGTTNIPGWTDQSSDGQVTTTGQSSLTAEAFNFNPSLFFNSTVGFPDISCRADFNTANDAVFSVHQLTNNNVPFRYCSCMRYTHAIPEKEEDFFYKVSSTNYSFPAIDEGTKPFSAKLNPISRANIPLAEVSTTERVVGTGIIEFLLDGTSRAINTSVYCFLNTAVAFSVGAFDSKMPIAAGLRA